MSVPILSVHYRRYSGHFLDEFGLAPPQYSFSTCFGRENLRGLAQVVLDDVCPSCKWPYQKCDETESIYNIQQTPVACSLQIAEFRGFFFPNYLFLTKKSEFTLKIVNSNYSCKPKWIHHALRKFPKTNLICIQWIVNIKKYVKSVLLGIHKVMQCALS